MFIFNVNEIESRMSVRKDSRERDVMTYRDMDYEVIYLYARGICAGNSSRNMRDKAIMESEVVESVGYDRSWMNHV